MHSWLNNAQSVAFLFSPILVTSCLRRKYTRLSPRYIFVFRGSLVTRLLPTYLGRSQLRNHQKEIGWWLAAESAVVVGWVNVVTKLDITVIDPKCTQSSWSLWLVSHWLMVCTCTGMHWQLQTHGLHTIHARHNTGRYKMHTTHTIYVTYTIPQRS